MSCCRKCCPPVISPWEFEITGGLILKETDAKIDLFPKTDIDLLKEKVICEYLKVITELEMGKRPSIEFILEEISAIDLENELDNREFIIQYYLNNNG